MAAKRRAATQINHDNWDEPEESEEAGSFTVASKDALEKRVLKVAKRRVKTSNNEGNKPAFASFTGFKSVDTPSNSTGLTATKPFEFLSDLSSKGTTCSKVTLSVMESKNELSPQEKYLADLKQLNCSVSNWIKKHVDTDPVCILTPVFSDYDKYLKQIQNERDNCKAIDGDVTLSVNPKLSFNLSSKESENKFKMTVPTTGNSSYAANTSTSEPSKNTGKSPLSFTDNDKPNVPSIFSTFKSETSVSSVFTKPDPASLMINPFASVLNKPGQNTSSSNGFAVKTEDKDQKKDEEDEESDEPPKVEFTPVQEEGSVYSTRCKVFVKKAKENSYADRGLGTLFVKKVGEEKHQLLVRAQTVLGNILVNVLLSSGVPLQRMGKNNVMMVCLPTPEDSPPPTTVLLRVKESDEADELLATLEKYKK